MAETFVMFSLIALVIVKMECSLYVSECFEECEHPDKYPEDKIRELLKASGGVYSTYFDAVTNSSTKAPRAMGRRSDRLLPETLCASTQRIVRPRVLKDDKNVPRFIVNIKNSSVPFEQVVKFETCSFGDAVGNLTCRKSGSFEDNKYVAGCVQKTDVIRLLYSTDNGDKLEYGHFVVPSACVCTHPKI